MVGGRLWVSDFNKCCGMSARYDDRVASIAADPAGFSQGFEHGHAAVRFVDHRVLDGSNYSDRPALVFFHHYTDFRMTYQAIRFQNFGDLLLCLDFRKPRDAETNRYKWNTNCASLTHSQFACQFWHIKHGDVQKIAISNNIFMHTRLRSRRKIANPIVGLLGGFEDRHVLCKNTGSKDEHASQHD